jgi:SAM-dependent methyltransferase
VGVEQRVLEPELMDDPSLDAAEHRRALVGLERLNRLSGAAAAVYAAVRDLLPDQGPPLRVLDLACGGGDVLLGVSGRGSRERRLLEAHGCDISPVAVEFARDRAEELRIPARFFRLDVLHEPLPANYDVLTCSLFLHHLAREDAVSLMRRMGEAARRRIVICDLERRMRHRWLIWLGTRLLTRSRIVHADGPRSLRAAFTLDEARQMAAEAGLDGATVERCRLCRFVLTWDKR